MQALQLVPKSSPSEIQTKLNLVVSKAKRKHPEEFLAVQELFLDALDHMGPSYPDDLNFNDCQHRNVIGAALRSLTQAGKIEKTGKYRQSTREVSSGRTVFQYRLKP